MKNTAIEEKLFAFMNGQLSEEEQKEVKQYLMEQGQDLSEFHEMAEVWEKMGALEAPSPSDKMRDQFYHNLAHFQEDERLKSMGLLSKLKQVWESWFEQAWAKQMAVGLAFLFLGIVVGYQMRGNSSLDRLESMAVEMQDMRKVMMLSMMEQQSASKRIKAVNMVHSIDDVDEKIINTLFKSLNEDGSIHVRLVAAEALQEFTNRSAVRQRLIESMATQTSPIVQLTLVDVLLTLPETEASKTLKQLIKDEMVNEEVRRKAAKGLGISL